MTPYDQTQYPRRVFSFDPGTTHTAFAELEIGTPETRLPTIVASGHLPNIDVLGILDERLDALGRGSPHVVVAVEKVVNYGNVVGNDVFSTVLMAGFLCDTARHANTSAYLVPNRDWVRTVTGNNKATDAEVYLRIKDRYAEAFGLSKAADAVGTPKSPGPLFPLRGNCHVRDAFGVGLGVATFTFEWGTRDNLERFRLFTV